MDFMSEVEGYEKIYGIMFDCRTAHFWLPEPNE